MNGIEPSSSSTLRPYSPIEGQSGSPSSTGEVCDSGVNIAHRHITEHVGTQSAGLQQVMELLKADDIAGARKFFHENIDKFTVSDIAKFMREELVGQIGNYEYQIGNYEYLCYFCMFVDESKFIQDSESASHLFDELKINWLEEGLAFDRLFNSAGCEGFRKKFRELASKDCNKFFDDVIRSSTHTAGNLDCFLVILEGCVTHKMIGDAVGFLMEDWSRKGGVGKIVSLFDYFSKMEILNITVEQLEFKKRGGVHERRWCLPWIVDAVKKCILNNSIHFQFNQREKTIEIIIKELHSSLSLSPGFCRISEKDVKGLVSEVLDAADNHFVEVFFSDVPVQRRKEVCLDLLCSMKDVQDIWRKNRLIGILCLGMSNDLIEDLGRDILELFQKNVNKSMLLEVCKTARDIGVPIDNELVIIEFHRCLMSSSLDLASKYLYFGLIERMGKNDFLPIINCVDSIVDGYAYCNDSPVFDFERTHEIYKIAKVLEGLICYIDDGAVDAELREVVNKCMLNIIHVLVERLECLVANVHEREARVQGYGRDICAKVFGMIDVYEKKLNQSFYELLSDSLKSKVQSVILSDSPYASLLLKFAIFSPADANTLIRHICNDPKRLRWLNELKEMDVLLDEATRKHIKLSLEKHPLRAVIGVHEDRREQLLSIPEQQTIKAFYEEQERLKVTGR